MTSVQSVKYNLCPVNFKADNRSRQSDPPMLTRQQQIDRYEKEQKAQKRKQNLSLAVSIGAGLAIIASVVMTALMMRKGGAAGANQVENEIKTLTDVPIHWERFTGENKVASLTAETTASSIKEELLSIIESDKLSPIKRMLFGAKKKTRLYYLFGESGVGKTYVAQQYAQEIGAEYACIKFGELGSAFQNTTGSRVLNMFRKIIEEANKNPDKKYVICIDEIDALLRRVTEHSGQEASNNRGSVLTGIDELVKKCKNVTVFATSNYHPNSKLIDQASMRRFKSGKIEVPLPDLKQCKALLKMYLKDIGLIKESFYKNPEFENFAKTLVDGKYSNGEIQNIAEKIPDILSSKGAKLTDEQAKVMEFSVDYLKKAKELIGEAAAISNDTMLH